MIPIQITQRETIILESAEIMQEIEGIFEQLSQALETVEDEKVVANIDRERAALQEQIDALDGPIEEISLYTKMRLEALPPVARGLLNYAIGKETSKVKDDDIMKSVLLKPSNLMEAKGSLRKLAETHLGRIIKIEICDSKVPKAIFSDNEFYLDDRTQTEVLVGKELNQPRVVFREEVDGMLLSPVVQIHTRGELDTVLDGHFFDDYAALGIQKRMTIIVS